MALNSIVVFGGSFDPVHLGHQKIIRTVLDQVRPQRLLVLPCGDPPHRSPLVANSHQRLQMLQLACGQIPHVEIDSRELHRQGPSYSYLTLQELRHETPEAQLFFAMGWDSLASFPSWYRWQDILQIASLLVVDRENNSVDIPPQMGEEILPWQLGCQGNGKVLKLDFDEVVISSTEVRSRLAQGLATEALLEAEVRRYIEQEHIYSNA